MLTIVREDITKILYLFFLNEYSTSFDVSVKTISEAKVYSIIHIGEFYHYSTLGKHILQFLVLLLFMFADI